MLPVPKDPPAWVLEELRKPRDYTADFEEAAGECEYLR